MARIVALAVTIALHVGVLLLITGNWRPFPAHEARRADALPKSAARPSLAAPDESVTAVLDWTRVPTALPLASSTLSVETRRMLVDLEQAREAGREHVRRWLEAGRRHNRQQYGDAIAALLDGPPGESWPALEQLVREGDKVAVAALSDLAERCRNRPGQPAIYARLADESSRGLDEVSAAFVRAALEQELVAMQERAMRCRAEGVGPERLEALIRARGDAPDTDIVRAFDEFYESDPGRMWGGPYGPVLDRATSAPGLGEEDWITLIAAAGSDPAVAYAIGYCLPRKCAGFPELPDSERRRLQRAAADAGNVWSVRALAEDLANGGDLASAYGWLLFARWADATGCNPVATTLDLARTLRGIASMEEVLTPGQRNAGEMLGASLIAANAAGARAVWSCPG